MNLLNTLKLNIIESGHVQVIHHWHMMKAHIFPYCRLYWILSGNGWVGIDGKKEALEEGYIYLLPTGRTIQLLPPPGELDHFYIHFNAEVMGGLDLFRLMKPPLRISQEEVADTLPDNMLEHFLSPPPTYRETHTLYRLSMLQLVLLPFLNRMITSGSASLEKQARFESVIRHIHRSFSSALSSADLANEMHLQPTYFSNLFTETFGVSPRHYICQVRVNHAQQRLISTDKSVKEIALECGYDDEFYFSRLFKRYTGISPRGYRDQRRHMYFHDKQDN